MALSRASTFFCLVGILLVAASCSSLSTVPRSALPAAVIVSDEPSWLVLMPKQRPSDVGLIFYPGGFVKPDAYLAILAPLAEAGFPVVVVKMPLDLAFFDAEKGLAARSAVPSVRRWAIGGHSLGGVASAIAVSKHPEAFSGVVFWASYPARENSLAALPLPALSITASNDGLSTPAKVAAAAGYLPFRTRTVLITGGNHAQFGSYGPQKGDGTATMSAEAQQEAVSAETVLFLAGLLGPDTDEEKAP